MYFRWCDLRNSTLGATFLFFCQSFDFFFESKWKLGNNFERNIIQIGVFNKVSPVVNHSGVINAAFLVHLENLEKQIIAIHCATVQK